MADYNNNRQGGGQQQQPRKKPKAPVDWAKLAMSVPCPTAPGQWSSLTWGVFNDTISLTLYTNDPADKDNKNTNYGKVKTSMQIPTFLVFLQLLDQAIKSKGEFKRAAQGLNWYGFGGQKRDAPKVETELFVGKDANGVMGITLVSPGGSKIVFNFSPKNLTHQWCDQAGNLIPEAEMSCLYARAYHTMLQSITQVDMLSKLVMHAKPGEYEPPAPKPYQTGGGQGGGGGGYQNNRQNNGGGQSNDGGQRAAPAPRAAVEVDNDDDVPY